MFEQVYGSQNNIVGIHRPLERGRLPRKEQKLLDDLSGMKRGSHDLLRVLSCIVGHPRTAFQQLRKTENAAERLVQFVGDTRRQLPDGSEAVRVHELFLQPGSLLFRLLMFHDNGDLSGDGVQQVPLVSQKGAFVKVRSLLRVDHLHYSRPFTAHDHIGRLFLATPLEAGCLISLSVQNDTSRRDFRVLPCRWNQLDNTPKHFAGRSGASFEYPTDTVQAAQLLHPFA